MLTKKISNWMIAGAIILGVAALTPDTVQAQWCETCDSLTAECTSDGPYLNDSCYSGEWGGISFCVSWGRLWCDPRITRAQSTSVGADGALVRERTFASVTSDAPGTPQSTFQHVRDCKNRIVARAYSADEAEDMRRRTESIVI
ncbi:MAG: hypothetical protein F4X22_16295 [Gemmatimonadales bacterium]|uniref:hypothetical protein n=1 Tax=Candidatus Palauibacter polyketidifaciens TaxID=3056740 RepID=UPI0013F981C0|nr:hypothetical protein [Candidatus Palauibacter polyketidifaciens]MDE2721289.1 hypothetical protein [Candidatus Palauibacter polyketidifaciens]MYC89769.1 hypothetical protein [Candidatus Palauibacter denitrificans]